MKILITGGAGYLGTELTARLAQLEQVTEIVVYDNLSRKNLNFFVVRNQPELQKIRFVHGELLDSRKLKSALNGVDVVYHLAAKVTTPFADEGPHAFEQVNQWGTAELTYLLEDSSVKTLIFTSSLSVYGSSGTIIPEGKEPNPRTYYGISKFLAEEMIQRLLGGKINTYVVRCANVFGYSKSMRFDAVINKFMFDAHYNQRIKIQGNGTQKRSFISVKEVSEALANLLVKSPPEGIYNLASRNFSVNDIAEHIQKLYPETETQYVQQSLTLKSLCVDPAGGLGNLGLFTASDFTEELTNIKNNFAFSPVG